MTAPRPQQQSRSLDTHGSHTPSTQKHRTRTRGRPHVHIVGQWVWLTYNLEQVGVAILKNSIAKSSVKAYL